MSDAHDGLIARLEETLTCQRYSRVVVHNYCRNARDFLSYLSNRSIAVEAVTPTQVSQYLRCAVRHFRERRGRPPAFSWTSIPRAGIHALLRFEQSGRIEARTGLRMMPTFP